jgi:hypothetical protein
MCAQMLVQVSQGIHTSDPFSSSGSEKGGRALACVCARVCTVCVRARVCVCRCV